MTAEVAALSEKACRRPGRRSWNGGPRRRTSRQRPGGRRSGPTGPGRRGCGEVCRARQLPVLRWVRPTAPRRQPQVWRQCGCAARHRGCPWRQRGRPTRHRSPARRHHEPSTRFPSPARRPRARRRGPAPPPPRSRRRQTPPKAARRGVSRRPRCGAGGGRRAVAGEGHGGNPFGRVSEADGDRLDGGQLPAVRSPRDGRLEAVTLDGLRMPPEISPGSLRSAPARPVSSGFSCTIRRISVSDLRVCSRGGNAMLSNKVMEPNSAPSWNSTPNSLRTS